MNTFELDSAYIAHTYKRFPLEIVGGKGSVVFGADGREYIDLGSGIATDTFGYCDEEWTNAVKAQLDAFAHTSNLYFTLPQVELAMLLCEKTGFKRVFFGNSGAEANEGMIKAARKYSFDKYGAGRNKIVALENSFHGRTVTTLSATGQDVFHNYFFPFTEGFTFIKANDTSAMLEAMNDKSVCAVMLELIQGEGGVNPLDREFVCAVAAKCEKDDILLCVDEVQTGNGRTGKLYCYENYGIMPDIISTAKGLGGGLPIGAVMFGEKTKDTLGSGSHGSTFGGNPVCAAGAYNIISRLDENTLNGVKEREQIIRDTLTGAEGIKSISGIGLMLGISTDKPAGEIVAECLKNGVMVLTAKEKVRLLPALNIDKKLLIKALEVIIKAAK